MKTILYAAILLSFYALYAQARPSSYDTAILRYIRDQYDLEYLNELFKRTDEDETPPNNEADTNTNGDEDVNNNNYHDDNSNSGSGSGGIKIVVAGKSLDLCDPIVAHLVQRAKSERFKKYYSLICASSSFGRLLSGFSKNGKLKALVETFKGGSLTPEALDKFFGKRDFSWGRNS